MKKLILVAILILTGQNLFAQFNSTDRLILNMPCTGNANDVSGNNNNGIVNGATLTTDRFGNANSAYDFLIDNHAYIEVPASPSMDSVTLYSGYTISAWIKPRSWNSGGTPLLAIIERHNLITDGGTDFLAFPFGTYFSGNQGNFNFQLDQWYNVVVTINPITDSLQFYVDGNNVGSFLYTTPIDTSNHGPYSIGTSFTGNTDEYSDGAIDDIKIYARALSSDEVINDYTGINTSDVLNNKLVFYPNPATKDLIVEGKFSSQLKFSMLNVLGQEIKTPFTKTDSNIKLNVNALAPGFYSIVIHDGNKLFTGKFIKE